MDDKLIGTIFQRLWERLKTYPEEDGNNSVELSIRLEDRKELETEVPTTSITLSKDELLKYIKENVESVVLDDKDIFVSKDKKIIEVPIYISSIGSSFRPLLSYRIINEDYKHDSKNKLEYKISSLSLGASIQLLLKEKSEYSKLLIRRMFRPSSYRDYSVDDKDLFYNEIKLKRKVLAKITSQKGHLYVIRIKNDDLKNIDFYKNYVNSLIFNMNLMNYRGCSFRIVDNLSDYVKGQSRAIHHFKNNVEPPKLHYLKRLTDLYAAGSWTDNPFTAFINYYQIIEYFFNEIPDNRLFEMVQSEITSPLFSYDNKEDVIKLAKEIYEVRQHDMNELHSLKIVLDHFLDIDMLKELLDEKIIKIYNKEIPAFIFGNKNSICFNINSFNDNWDENIDKLARRIYSIRNALVHNKDNSQNNYNPQYHYKSLIKEVPLIRAIASSIIIKSGSPF